MPQRQQQNGRSNPDKSLPAPFNGPELGQVELPVEQVGDRGHAEQNGQNNTGYPERANYLLLTFGIEYRDRIGVLHRLAVFAGRKVAGFSGKHQKNSAKCEVISPKSTPLHILESQV